MKNLGYAFLIGLVVFSCSNTEKRTDYVINGTAKDIYNGIRVYLNKADERGRMKAVDTAIVMNGEFVFNGKVDIPSLHFLTVNNIPGRLAIMVENSEISIIIDKNNFQNTKIIGSKSHDIITEFNTETNTFKSKYLALNQELRKANAIKDDSAITKANNAIKSLDSDISNFHLEFIKTHDQSFAVIQVFESLLRVPNTDIEKISETFDSLNDDVKLSDSGKAIKKKIEDLQIKRDKEKITAIGATAPNFSAPNPNGETLALKDVVSKGKITIVDFWAAWCGPCRKENPNVVNIYNKYHDKGLEIIGVSLDGARGQQNPKEAWLKAIEDDKLTWHQVSNLNYFGPIAQQYNINAIPAMFILDNNGKIIAKNLRGKALELKVDELLSKS